LRWTRFGNALEREAGNDQKGSLSADADRSTMSIGNAGSLPKSCSWRIRQVKVFASKMVLYHVNWRSVDGSASPNMRNFRQCSVYKCERHFERACVEFLRYTAFGSFRAFLFLHAGDGNRVHLPTLAMSP
jgi:hypothetical protein